TGTPGTAPVTITPPQGPAGQTVSISAIAGTFPSNSTITIAFTDPLGGSPVQIATATSNADGSLSATNAVLPAAATYGAATITLSASNATTKTVSYFVLSSITINPATVP